MKSLLYTAALLPLGALAWGGKSQEIDEVVIVTSTRTITVCPITEAWTCPPDDPTATWEDWSASHTGAVTTSNHVSPASTTGGHGNGGGDGGHGSHGSSSTAAVTSSYGGGDDGHGGHGGHGSSSTAATTSSYGGGDDGHGGHGGHGTSSTSGSVGPETTSSWSDHGNGGGHGSWTSSSSSTSSSETSSVPVDGSSTSSYSYSFSHPVGPDTTSSSPSQPTYTTSYSHPAGPDTTSSYSHPAGPDTTSSYSHPAGPDTTSSYSHPTGPDTTSSTPSQPTYTTSSYSHPAGPDTTSSYSHPAGPDTTSSYSHPTGPDTTSSTPSQPTYTTSSYSHPEGPDTTSSYSQPTYTTSSYSHPEGPDTTSSYSQPTYTTSSSSSAPTTSTTTSSSPTTSSPTTSISVTSTTSAGLTTSSALTTTTSSRTSTTSTTSCLPSQTVSALPESDICTDNTAADRSTWCGKSVGADTDSPYESGQTKNFQLTITSDQSNFDGTLRPAFLINGGTPGPVIEVNYGDWVEVTVTNLLTDNATTIHWHGIRQKGTNDQDGVPGVTECAIPPLGQRTYRWLASTYGTGWYHSHALSQYGGGIRGAVVIHGPSTANYDYDLGTVMVDEIFSQTIFQMAWNIARLRGPLPAAVNYMLNGKNKAVDGSAGKSAEWTVYPGKKHLFRIINSSAQASYVIHFDNHQMQVISADYTPIVPYTTDTLYINPGQRYNVIVEMNQTPGAYFLRAITQTGCGESNLNNGLGSLANGIFTYKGSCGVPVTDAKTATIGATLQTDCKDEPLSKLVPFNPKNGGTVDQFTQSALLLPGGNAAQQTYANYGPITRWYFGPMTNLVNNSATTFGSNSITVDFDNPTLKNMATLPTVPFTNSIYSNAVVLDGPAGDWVYFVIQNNFQTSHPIHLHGHDFSVLGQGKGVFSAANAASLNFANPIRRDTALLFGFPAVNGNPVVSGWTVIGFQTDNPGAWVMHCHIIWHADGGMALQYIEQPASIPASTYYASSSFQNECAAYDAYSAAGGEGHLSYESGLKRDLQRHAYRETRFGRHGMH